MEKRAAPVASGKTGKHPDLFAPFHIPLAPGIIDIIRTAKTEKDLGVQVDLA